MCSPLELTGVKFTEMHVEAFILKENLILLSVNRPMPIVLRNFWRLEQLYAVPATSSNFHISKLFLSKI